MSPLRSDHKVLIIAAEPLLAALIGILVELTDLKAAFPAADERPEDALARVRPLAAILIDAMTQEAESDLFVARARQRRVPVMIFGAVAAIETRAAWASERGVRTFALPAESDAMRVAIEQILAPARAAVTRSERRAHAVRAPNGTLVFVDDTGTRWSVYDRRGSADRRLEGGFFERRFVSDNGETKSCSVPIDETQADSPDALSAQLAHATADGK